MPFDQDELPLRPPFDARRIPGYRIVGALWAFTGERCGVDFKNGWAQVDPEEEFFSDSKEGLKGRKLIDVLREDLGYRDFTDELFPPAEAKAAS